MLAGEQFFATSLFTGLQVDPVQEQHPGLVRVVKLSRRRLLEGRGEHDGLGRRDVHEAALEGQEAAREEHLGDWLELEICDRLKSGGLIEAS